MALSWKQLAEAILQLPEDQLDQPANVFMQQTGLQAIVESIDLAEDWVEPIDYKYTLIYE